MKGGTTGGFFDDEHRDGIPQVKQRRPRKQSHIATRATS